MATKLIFIRHGQTEWNLKKKYAGSTDIPLNQKGKAQARKLKKRLSSQTVDKIYVSNKKRALETAKIIFSKCKIERIADLREIHFGVFEGLTYQQVMQKHPLVLKKWLKDPFNTTIPKGENLKDFKQRVVKAICKIIVANQGKTVAVVCHGGSISIFLNHILKSKEFWKQIPSSASISVVEEKKGKTKIKVFNDISHLEKTNG